VGSTRVGTGPGAGRGSSGPAAPLTLEPVVDDHRAPDEQPAPVAGPPELTADLAAQKPEPPRADPAEQRGGGRADDQHVAKGNEVVSVRFEHGSPSAPGTAERARTYPTRRSRRNRKGAWRGRPNLTPAVSRSTVMRDSVGGGPGCFVAPHARDR